MENQKKKSIDWFLIPMGLLPATGIAYSIYTLVS